jgi:hypothetical protein
LQPQGSIKAPYRLVCFGYGASGAAYAKHPLRVVMRANRSDSPLRRAAAASGLNEFAS